MPPLLGKCVQSIFNGTSFFVSYSARRRPSDSFASIFFRLSGALGDAVAFFADFFVGTETTPLPFPSDTTFDSRNSVELCESQQDTAKDSVCVCGNNWPVRKENR